MIKVNKNKKLVAEIKQRIKDNNGRFAFKIPSLFHRYDILIDTPNSSAKSFGL